MDTRQTEKVAALARLSLSEDELQTYGEQLTQILGYVDLLDEVNIDGVEPMPHAVELQNVFREDERQPSLNRADALSNAPKTDGKFFQVPQILENKE